MNGPSYLILISPIACWFCTGCFKFLLTSIRHRTVNLNNIGYGGFPSNHTSIVSCTFTTCLILKGSDDAGTIACLGLLLIVIIDALGLRNHVGGLAKSINKIQGKSDHREIMGHSRFEVFGGLVFGFLFSGLYVSAVQYVF